MLYNVMSVDDLVHPLIMSQLKVWNLMSRDCIDAIDGTICGESYHDVNGIIS